MRATTMHHPLLDYILEKFNLKNDRALAEYCNLTPPTVSKIRNHNKVSPVILWRIHESTGITAKEMKEYISY